MGADAFLLDRTVGFPAEAGAGKSPRRASHFLCFAKESNQRKATPAVCDPSLRYGHPAVLVAGGSRRTRFAQTAAALFPPAPALLGTARGGQTGQLALWALRHRRLVLRTSPQTASAPHITGERSEACRGPSEATARPKPLWLCRGAQRQAGKASQLFERSEFCDARLLRAPQGARSEAQGHRQRGRLFFAYFLLAKQKKVGAPPGAHPGQQPMQCHQTKHPRSATNTTAAPRKAQRPTPCCK